MSVLRRSHGLPPGFINNPKGSPSCPALATTRHAVATPTNLTMTGRLDRLDPNWDDDDDAAPSKGDLKESDSEIHGTEETKLDDASAVDDTAAVNQAPDANTSLDGGSPPSCPPQIPPTLWRVTLHPFWILPSLIVAHHLNTWPGLPLVGPQPRPPSTLWPN